MKKLFFIAMVLMAACTMSLDKKADSLIKEEMRKTLYHPESYDPIETIVDSAFAPDDDPALFEKITKIMQIGSEIESLEEEASNYRSTISIFSGPYVSEYGKNQKAEAQSKLDKANSEIERLTSKAQKVGKEIKSMLSTDKKFIGFKANHSYRAKNNIGNVLLGRSIFIIDEPMKKVIFSCNSEEYEQIQEAIEMIKERMEENNTFDDNPLTAAVPETGAKILGGGENPSPLYSEFMRQRMALSNEERERLDAERIEEERGKGIYGTTKKYTLDKSPYDENTSVISDSKFDKSE